MATKKASGKEGQRKAPTGALVGRRRDVVFAGLGAVATAIVGGAGSELGADIIRTLKQLVRDRPPALSPDDLLDLLLFRNQPTQLIPANGHPLLTAEVAHADSLLPLQDSLDYLRLRTDRRQEIVLVPTADRVHRTTNLVLFGSPVSHTISKRVLGYSGSNLDLRRDSGPLLHWSYAQTRSDVTENCKRYEGGQLHEVPNWLIVDEAPGRRPLRPSTDSDGFLTTDYLLITRLQNPWNPANWVVIVGGSHGLATRAFGELARNPGLLKEAAKKIPDSTIAFQTLFFVGGVRHDHKTKLTSWTQIEHVSTQLLRFG